ncbi:hypothetical protein ACFVQ9_05645 [Streptomyces goshikiensis]|uniref:hypothetical protein n=1 Tax=Streptomyces goshikiensis TaxID=1942 RepID=UPI00369A2B5D
MLHSLSWPTLALSCIGSYSLAVHHRISARESAAEVVELEQSVQAAKASRGEPATVHEMPATTKARAASARSGAHTGSVRENGFRSNFWALSQIWG